VTENIGFQIAIFANRLRSETNLFENCPARARDYRFYGTIGYWDQLFLDLKKGRNEIVIAVSENFGGWGVEAKFDDLTDLSISAR